MKKSCDVDALIIAFSSTLLHHSVLLALTFSSSEPNTFTWLCLFGLCSLFGLICGYNSFERIWLRIYGRRRRRRCCLRFSSFFFFSSSYIANGTKRKTKKNKKKCEESMETLKNTFSLFLTFVFCSLEQNLEMICAHFAVIGNDWNVKCECYSFRFVLVFFFS